MKPMEELIDEIEKKHKNILIDDELKIINLANINNNLYDCVELLKKIAITQNKITKYLQKICDTLPDIEERKDER